MKWISYKRQAITESYDAIIIGSGLGGLSTAAILSKEGKKVLVLEKHFVAGGFTHVFKRKDYEWDVGLHYVGEVHRPGTQLRKVFDYVSEGQLKWAEMDETYDIFYFGNDRYEYIKGKKAFIEKISSYFPEERKAIEKYVELIYKAAKKSAAHFATSAFPIFWHKILQGIVSPSFYKFSDKTTLEILKSLSSNQKLIAVLSGQYGDYGLPPSQSSFAIHAMVAKHYMNGGAYPVGGSQRIAETIYPTIKKAGGEILVNAEVKQILVKNKQAVGVLMADGKTISAKQIISNVGLHNTFNQLIDGAITEINNLKVSIKKSRPSTSHICLYVGINENRKSLGLKNNGNLWCYPNYDYDKAISDYLANPESPFPVVYISFPSAKDPDWENRYPDKTTIEIITLAPYDWFKKWENMPWKKRGDDYEALKERLSNRMLEELYKKVPEVKGKIDFYELSTPLSTKHFTSYSNGEIYGIDNTPERFRFKFMQPKTPIDNLYLTGQDAVTVGIGGALFSGVITASKILKNPFLIKKIIKGS